MTLEEKRSFVVEYCGNTPCSVCNLRGGGWEYAEESGCLIISESSEKDLDRAIAIIRGESEDPVNRPNHYTSGGIECIDALEASMSPIEYAGFLKGQVFKYIWRYRLKGKPSEDLKKARYYLDRLIQITEREEVAV